jgi:hypothetical protein
VTPPQCLGLGSGFTVFHPLNWTHFFCLKSFKMGIREETRRERTRCRTVEVHFDSTGRLPYFTIRTRQNEKVRSQIWLCSSRFPDTLECFTSGLVFWVVLEVENQVYSDWCRFCHHMSYEWTCSTISLFLSVFLSIFFLYKFRGGHDLIFLSGKYCLLLSDKARVK